MAKHYVTTPLTAEFVAQVRSGDEIYVSGTIYTARDAAHKRMLENLAKGIPLPMDPQGALIYYTGPTPPQPGKVIPSAGPTTSYRMDKYTPDMLRLGVKAVLGKGYRSDEVKAALLAYKGLYVTATGGAGAMLAQCIKAAEVIAYEDLGPEAIRKLTVENLPLQCIHDIYGGDQYYEGQKQWVEPDAMFQPRKPEASE